MHQEMPQRSPDGMDGFQLWVNLPRAKKMMEPRYRDVRKETIPEVELGGGATVKVIAGNVNGIVGPVRDLVVPVELLDVTIGPGGSMTRELARDNHAFAFVIKGGARLEKGGPLVQSEHVAVFGEGDGARIEAGPEGVRLLLVSGRPVREPIAWRGPVVMNTEEELMTAFREIRSGQFIKSAETVRAGSK
jgi:quercetin 2,3-dioxygenase